MTTYTDWARRHPQAAADLQAITAMPVAPPDSDGKSEAWAQQRDRMRIAHAGGMAWRNNVGAIPAKTQHECPHCRAKFTDEQRPIRYGLANDSHKLNQRIKSGDLIGIIPRLITPVMVGTTIGQFASIEDKRPGWHYTGTEHEQAQLAWQTIILRLGGFAQFSTGDVTL